MRKRIARAAQSLADRLTPPTPEPARMPDDMTLTVVISGAPFEVKAHSYEKIHVLIRSALEQAGIKNTEIVGWTLRSRDGKEISTGARLEDSGVVLGEALYLDVDAGGGGAILKEGGMSLRVRGPRSTHAPPKPVDAATSARIRA